MGEHPALVGLLVIALSLGWPYFMHRMLNRKRSGRLVDLRGIDGGKR